MSQHGHLEVKHFIFIASAYFTEMIKININFELFAKRL